MCALRSLLFLFLVPVCASAQPAPLVGSTVRSTTNSTTSMCVGCAIGSSTPTVGSGAMVDVVGVTGRVIFGTSVTPTANGTIQKSSSLGLLFLGVAGSASDFSIYNPSGAGAIMTNPTGTVNVAFGGNVSPAGAVQFGTSAVALANATIQKTAAAGLTLLGATGSSYDLALYTPSGGTAILRNPTGTSNLETAGTLAIGGANVTDATATPTVTSCGTDTTIAGKVYAFRITIGAGNPTACTIAFNMTFANAAACTFTSKDNTTVVRTNTSTTGAVLAIATGWASTDVISGMCRGF